MHFSRVWWSVMGQWNITPILVPIQPSKSMTKVQRVYHPADDKVADLDPMLFHRWAFVHLIENEENLDPLCHALESSLLSLNCKLLVVNRRQGKTDHDWKPKGKVFQLNRTVLEKSSNFKKLEESATIFDSCHTSQLIKNHQKGRARPFFSLKLWGLRGVIILPTQTMHYYR